MTNAIEVENLHKSYSKGFFLTRADVLKGLSFNVPAGHITGFLGSNGSGKTTTIKCILDLVRFQGGLIRILGQDSRNPESRRRIGFLPERPYFYEYLTGREFLEFYGSLSIKMKKSDLRARIEFVLKSVDLLHAGDKHLRTYSKGMLQRVGLGQAIIHKPDLLILDEPMSGLDPDGRAGISNLIREVANSGTTVFFSTHLLPDIENLCDRLLILRSGNVAFDGSKSELLRSLNTRFIIQFAKDGNEQEIKVDDLGQVQSTIDSLRNQRNSILEVKPDRPSLESIYLEIAKVGHSEAKNL